jgi:hypothetical protein
MANLFRLYLHALAASLLARLRGVVADPPPPAIVTPLPTKALAGTQRHDYFDHRRERDPLGAGQPCTWRTRLIKVAAEIVVRARRVVVRLASSWPYLDHYRRVAQAVLGCWLPPAPESGLAACHPRTKPPPTLARLGGKGELSAFAVADRLTPAEPR